MFKRRPLGQHRPDQPSSSSATSNSESGGFSQATGGLPPAQSQTPTGGSAPAGSHARPQQNQARPNQGPRQGDRQGDRQGNSQGGRQNQNRNRNRNAGGNRPGQNAQGPQGQGQSGQGPQQGNNQQPGQNQRRNRNQNQRSAQGAGAPGQQRNRNQRGRPEPRRAPPPPPPAFIQRDVLLIPQPGAVEGIELVRAKFDPLAKKLPAHVTLVFPQPANLLSKEFLKDFSREELPALDSITFTSVIVHEDMYLWLVPDEESKQKLIPWREALMQKLKSKPAIAGLETSGEAIEGQEAQSEVAPEEIEEEVDDEEFIPHLTLGYIPRSITPEDALTFVKTHVTLPLIVPLEKIMLEEFPESQISTLLDSLALNAQESQ